MLEVGKRVSGTWSWDMKYGTWGWWIWGHSDETLVGGLIAAEGDKKGTVGQKENATTTPGPTSHHSPPPSALSPCLVLGWNMDVPPECSQGGQRVL